MLRADEPVDTVRFLRLGRLLGRAMPETDPAVQPFVEESVILNLRSEHDRTANVSLQPFATNFLSLHTESSGRPVPEQPRYIVLMCQDPGDASAAQTVLVPMAEVAAALPAADLDLLTHVRYRREPRLSPVCRRQDDRWVFSFRDFLDQPLDWHAGGGDGQTVNAALSHLLTAMYSTPGASGVHWARGLIVILDNRYFFHGRTAGPAVASPHHRHLRRLRVAS